MRRLGALALALLLAATVAAPADAGDPRWAFYTKDKTYYTSPWFQGAHRIMVRTAKEWRDKAETTRTAARSMSTAEGRDTLVRISEEYERLAKKAEANDRVA